MAFFSFYNVRKPRQFEHKPIYWDPHKEEMEERVRRIKREMGMEEGLIRISVGIEDVQDLIADFRQALTVFAKAK